MNWNASKSVTLIHKSESDLGKVTVIMIALATNVLVRNVLVRNVEKEELTVSLLKN